MQQWINILKLYYLLMTSVVKATQKGKLSICEGKKVLAQHGLKSSEN